MATDLSSKYRAKLSGKVMDWANLLFIGLVIAQVVPANQEFDWQIAIAGNLFFAGAYYFAYRLMMGGGN
jgi:hypothetical protein